MRKRQFGRTSWSVSEIGFGAWAIGSAWGPVKDDESLGALRVSLDNGVDFLDTADVYGDEHKSERLIAAILKERKKHGKSVPLVATKIGRRLPKQDAAVFTYANLAPFVEDSLKGEWKISGLSGRQREISCCLEPAVQHCCANYRDAVGSSGRPSHTLLLGHARIGDFIHTAFRARC